MATVRSQIAAPLLGLAIAGSMWGGPSPGEASALSTSCTAVSGGHALFAAGSDSQGLALCPRARLAPAKVLALGSQPLGIDRVVADQAGAERREDVGTQVAFDVQAEVPFTKGSARLSSSARSRIGFVVQEMEPQANTTIRVRGFTDDLGSAARGEALSLKRAVALQGVLTEEPKGAAVSSEARRFGERQPLASKHHRGQPPEPAGAAAVFSRAIT